MNDVDMCDVYDSVVSAIKDLPIEKILELQIFIEKLTGKKRKEVRRFAKKQIIEIMEKSGISSIDELGFYYAEKTQNEINAKKVRPVKYSFEGNEWSGIGREPNWVSRKAQENEMSVDEFKERIEVKKED